jgi:outer membrane autotransporter protein
MNRVFRVVWNSSLGLWAVASELTPGAGKSTAQARSAPDSIGILPAFARSRGLQAAVAGALLAFAGAASADCTSAPGTITCAPGATQTMIVGSGPGTPSGTSVEIQSGADVSTGGLPAISTGDNANIVVRGGATVQNNAPEGSIGYYGTGANTVEFNSGNTLTIEQGAKVLSTGTAHDAEAINPIGSGNTIVNHGEVRSQAGGAAIWFEASNGSNTVVNGPSGIIEYKGGTGSVIHVGGTMAIDFTNEGQVIGGLRFADGDDKLRIGTGSSITGAVDGGGGSNELHLMGSGTDTFTKAVTNFQSLVKDGSGTWTFGNVLPGSGITSTRVAQGTLILGTDASAYTGSMTVDAAGTLQTTAQFAPAAITDNGLVRFAQPDDASYGGLLSGSGGIEKTGTGVLTLTRAQAVTGTTSVAAGTLTASAAGIFGKLSAHTVAAGATLDTGGFDQTVAALNNAGTVKLLSGTAGSTLTVNGAYVGNNGVLKLGTVLGDSSSVSDRLVLNGAGASASGRTTVQITNLGGLGARTSGNGIEVVSARNGATTTAQTTRDAFALANGHVDAGAYEYRLYAADAGGAGENWYLRSETMVPPPTSNPGMPTPSNPDPGTPNQNQSPSDSSQQAPIKADVPPAVAIPTYRAEVPLFAALPAQLRQGDLAMIGNLHRRVGDEAATDGRQAWARAVYTDLDIRQGGTAAPQSQGHLAGVQAGTDLLVSGNWRAGLYVGTLDGGADVSGNARGVFGPVGNNDLQSRYLGAYATWLGADGWYADGVLQAGSHRYTVRPDGNPNAQGKARSVTASIEGGKAFALTERWTIEPQAQLIHQQASFDDVLISGARVRQDAHDGWIGRIGVRVKGDIATGAGRLQPYARLNLYRASSGSDVATFVGPAASTPIASASGYTTTEVAGGFTLALTPTTMLYGELGRLFSSGGDARVKSSVQGSLGVRVSW